MCKQDIRVRLHAKKYFGIVLSFEAPFSNDLLALASCEFSAVAKFFSVNAGMALKRIQEFILLSYTQDLLDDNEFCLLYDANYANYPVFDHGQYTRFTPDAVSEEECLSSFRFRQLDIPYLAQVLRLPEKFICPNRTAALTEEALCILLTIRLPMSICRHDASVWEITARVESDRK